MTENPFLKRAAARNVGHNGRRAEEKLANRIGATLTPASGAMQGAKGDMKLNDFLIESKATQNDSISLKRDWALKIYQEALETNKRPALAIVFTTDEGSSHRKDRWVMMTEADFLELIGE